LYKLGQVKWLPENSFLPKSLSLKTAFNKYAVSWEGFKKQFHEFQPEKHSKFKYLSSGERRLVEAYITLKSPGDIVLLDEPFKSLSPLVCERLKAIIHEEKKTKLLIAADHHPEHWNGLADVRYLLKDRGLRQLD
jgi:ABC-type lipopolysaccharide export system ATPase subunit